MTSSPARSRPCRGRHLLSLLTATLLVPVPALLGGPPAVAADDQPATTVEESTLPSYELLDLGRAPVPTWNNGHGQPSAVSDTGIVVGRYTDDQGYYHAWEWVAGARGDRGLVGHLNDVNDAGQAVGMNYHQAQWNLTRQAWLSEPGGGSFLPFHSAEGESDAEAINDAGVAVGWSDPYDETSVRVGKTPVKWEAGAPVELPKLTDQVWGLATAINDSGTIAGLVQARDESYNTTYNGGVLWEDGAIRTVPGLRWPHDLADSGIMVADWHDGTRSGPVRWEDGGAPEWLERIPGHQYSLTATAVNDAGDAVGSSESTPVLWPAGSTTPVPVQDLVPAEDAEYQILQVTDINNAGWITGAARLGDAYVPVLLRPASLPPVISDLSVEQRDVPSAEWGDVPAEGTIDGNTVRVAATVTNREATAKEVKLFVSVDDDLLTDVPLTASVPANSSTTITHEWDTTGKAWEHSSPAPDRTFEVRLMADNQEAGTKTVDLHVRPRPLVLVHGFNATAATWSAYPGIVGAVRPDWGVYAVGDGQAPGAMDTGSLTSPTTVPRTIVDNAETMAGYVAGVRDSLDAQSVDVVAHSMGGLISRQYVESFMGTNAEGENVASQLVMLGTPNHGSPCASLLPLAGMYELRPEVVAEYNTRMTNRPGVPMSVLAGDALGFTCDQEGPSDGVVAVPSAVTGYPDHAQVGRIHTAITGEVDFTGFVLPRLIRGAGGGDPAALQAASAAGASSPQLLGTTTATVSAGAPVELPVQVGTADAFGVSFVAPAHVTAALVAPDGAVAATSTAGDGQPVTTARVEQPATGGWTVRLTSTQTGASTVPLSTWVSGSPVSLDLQPVTVDAHGRATVSVTLTDGGTPVQGATVTASLRPVAGGPPVLATLAAAGTAYAGTSAPLTPGRHLVEVTATTASGPSRTTLGSVEVGEVLPLPTEPDPGPTEPSRPGKGCGKGKDRPAHLPACPPKAGGAKR